MFRCSYLSERYHKGTGDEAENSRDHSNHNYIVNHHGNDAILDVCLLDLIISNVKKKAFEGVRQNIEVIKSSGVGIARKHMWDMGKRFVSENANAMNEAHDEAKVLNMKRYFTRRGWMWPPLKHPVVTVVHLINSYYGKEVCKHVPEDELEKKVKKK